VLEWYDFVGKEIAGNITVIVFDTVPPVTICIIVALIGGLWLLWVGVSLVTVVQFMVASLKFCCHCLLPSEIDSNDH